MRKAYPGIGAIKLMVEVVYVHKSFARLKLTSYWSSIMSVKQTRDFLHKGTGKLPGPNSLYYLKRDGKLFRIPTALKHTIVPLTVLKYETRQYHIRVTPQVKATDPFFENLDPS
jgi:hypothetical protein